MPLSLKVTHGLLQWYYNNLNLKDFDYSLMQPLPDHIYLAVWVREFIKKNGLFTGKLTVRGGVVSPLGLDRKQM